MTQYKFVGPAADTLGDGRPIGPGDYVDLDPAALEDPHNKRLIEDERLIEAEGVQAPQDDATPVEAEAEASAQLADSGSAGESRMPTRKRGDT